MRRHGDRHGGGDGDRSGNGNGSWLTRRSFRSRITLLVVAAVGLSVALCALIGYLAISRTIMNRMDHQLEQRATVFTAWPLEMFSPSKIDQAQTLLASSGYQESLVFADGTAHEPQNLELQRLGPQGRPDQVLATYQVWAPFGQPEIAVAAQQRETSLRTFSYNGVDYRVYAIRNTYGDMPTDGDASPDGTPAADGSADTSQSSRSSRSSQSPQAPQSSALVFSTSLAPTESALNTIATISIVVGLLGIALATCAGLAIGRAALRPVVRLSQATEYIARTGDLARLPVKGDDEIAHLTRNFNTMLEALARSREHQKRLVADAGHELRTPLTSIRTNLDLLAQVSAAPDDARLPAEERVALLNDVRAQMEELSMLISDLVELSRDDQPAQTIEQLNLRDVVERAAERVQRRAPRITYDLRLRPWYLQGDATALERLVTNLLDNATKFSPEAGTITVTLADGLLQVADQGPGIAEEDLTHVFERFYRSPEARSTPGSGLGLAIVLHVATNHGGEVAAARAPGGGALLSVRLPGSPARVEEPVATA
ncbi:histidine kinase [Catenulispora acidiphila DSM 44928]|uniref:histidine kinase n=1 Tax=Catenulispora acidiphila (strain DSM 44928 / JCM 14897 / NBRC 102108 / NRRL B-24433 / ID139908) TaxID=479433 RepID=C7Q9A4_CATAD|nr:histidine kinase [Catenulispora acidiphila DSM 44928]